MVFLCFGCHRVPLGWREGTDADESLDLQGEVVRTFGQVLAIDQVRVVLSETAEAVGADPRRAEHGQVHCRRAALLVENTAADTAVMTALGHCERRVALGAAGRVTIWLPVRLAVEFEVVSADDVLQVLEDVPCVSNVRAGGLIWPRQQRRGNCTDAVEAKRQVRPSRQLQRQNGERRVVEHGDRCQLLDVEDLGRQLLQAVALQRQVLQVLAAAYLRRNAGESVVVERQPHETGQCANLGRQRGQPVVLEEQASQRRESADRRGHGLQLVGAQMQPLQSGEIKEAGRKRSNRVVLEGQGRQLREVQQSGGKLSQLVAVKTELFDALGFGHLEQHGQSALDQVGRQLAQGDR